MNKKISVFVSIFLFMVSSGFSQRILHYSIDSEGSLVVGGSTFVYDRYGDIDRTHTTVQNLEIPEYVEGRKVTGIAKKAFYDDSNIISVSIPKSISYIGPNAFNACRSIKSFYISPENPRYEVKGNLIVDKINSTLVSVFGDPVEIIIPDGIKEIPDNFFSDSDKLKKVTIPDSVTRIGERAFYEMYYIESINIPKNLEYIGDEAFCRCWAFSGDVDLSESLIYLGKAAFSETRISSVKLPEHLTSIPEQVFAGCKSLKDINFPKNLNSIEEFSLCGCSKLVDPKIPNTVEFIGNRAFEGIKFNVLKIPSGMKSIPKGAFYRISAEKIIFSSNIKMIEEEAFYNATIWSFTIPKSIESIGDRAFFECDIRTLTIENGIKSIGKHAFYHSNIYELILPDSITFISPSAFELCSIGKLTVPSKLKTIPKAFSGCTITEETVIP